jgi:transglutaminase-like putative cysteine protease
MRYTVRHVTRFTYETPITESVMEARMQPRSDGFQRCVHFALTTSPQARVMTYPDHDGNAVHHFDIPTRHSRLAVTAEALVDSIERPPMPDALGPGAWGEIDALSSCGEWFEHLAPSAFARPTPALDAFARELRLDRNEDPLQLLRRIMQEMSDLLEYRPKSTSVDSPIDEALTARCGVCQDFAHIFIALARQLGIPSRYVSGYLFPRTESEIRTTEHATHAWAECYLPGLGWSGFDPTNNEEASEGHIRVALGRDYSDVPPTRGVYKGASGVRTELAVAVRVASVKPAVSGDILPFTPWMSRDAGAPLPDPAEAERQQQQQQQQ